MKYNVTKVLVFRILFDNKLPQLIRILRILIDNNLPEHSEIVAAYSECIAGEQENSVFD